MVATLSLRAAICGGHVYLPMMIIWDAIVIFSAEHLIDPRRPNRIRDIRRIYLSGLGLIIAFIIIRLARS